MWLLWSAESRLRPFQQFGNSTRSRSGLLGHDAGTFAVPVTPSPQFQLVILVGCGLDAVAVAEPAIIFRPRGNGRIEAISRILVVR